MPKMNPFFANLALYQDMAKTLETDADFLMSLSSMESGWLNAHNQGLHNLFGVTAAGGNNLSFTTYQKAADFWVEHFGDYVRGAKTMDAFADGLKKAKYNSVNPAYYDELKKQLATVVKYKNACGIR
nr:glucosaminidase domain-containing protein [uncultured Rhodopila sp.]